MGFFHPEHGCRIDTSEKLFVLPNLLLTVDVLRRDWLMVGVREHKCFIPEINGTNEQKSKEVRLRMEMVKRRQANVRSDTKKNKYSAMQDQSTKVNAITLGVTD